MKIMVNVEGTDDFQEVDIEEDSTILDLKLTLQALFNIQFDEMDLKVREKILNNNVMLLKDIKVGDDVLFIVKKPKTHSNQQGNLGNIFSQAMQRLNNNNNTNNRSNNNNNNNNNSIRVIRANNNNNSNNNNNRPQNLGDAFSNFMQGVRNNPSPLPSPSGNRGYINYTNYFASLSKDLYIKQEAKNVKEKYLNNPNEFNMLFMTDTELANAIAEEDDKKLEDIIRKRVDDYEKEKSEREQEYIRLMNSDPSDVNAQKRIAELIKKKNIEENLKYAAEYLPETLISIHMLYINLEINKTKIVALVDTGAQSTIISKELAEKCDLINLCDERYQGIAQGVGTSKILGVIHAAQIKIEDKFIMCKITVLENNSVGFIFGLDNMRSYRCNVDLMKNALVFPDANIQTKFLSDGEVRKLKEEQIIEKEDEDIQKAHEESLKDMNKNKNDKNEKNDKNKNDKNNNDKNAKNKNDKNAKNKK